MTALYESLTLAVTIVAIAGLWLCTCPNRRRDPLERDVLRAGRVRDALASATQRAREMSE